MEQNKLYFTIGLPRSGKSTECKNWLRKENDINTTGRLGNFVHKLFGHFDVDDRIVVSPDRWRLALGHRYNWFVEPVVFSHIQIAVRGLLIDYNVILDDTNTTPESIKRIYEVDPDAIAIPIATPAEVCKERAIKTGQPDLATVIDRMSINMSLNYGKKFENLEKTLNDIRTEVITHSSRKVVI